MEFEKNPFPRRQRNIDKSGEAHIQSSFADIKPNTDKVDPHLVDTDADTKETLPVSDEAEGNGNTPQNVYRGWQSDREDYEDRVEETLRKALAKNNS